MMHGGDDRHYLGACGQGTGRSGRQHEGGARWIVCRLAILLDVAITQPFGHCSNWYLETTTGVSPKRQLGCRVKADSDLGAIGDVDLIARLQALDEGLHSRILHVDSVGHAVRAGEGDAASVGCCGDDGYARSCW